MTSAAVARQYAHAAYDVVCRSGQADEVGRQLQSIADLVLGHTDLARALESVAVPRHAKRDLIMALADHVGPISPELRRLFGLMADNDRLAIIPAVAAVYRERLMAAAGVVKAELISAQPLDAERQAALARALGAVTGHTVEVTGRVDESIIGGLIARVGGTVYDGSVASQLDRMRQRLLTEA